MGTNTDMSEQESIAKSQHTHSSNGGQSCCKRLLRHSVYIFSADVEQQDQVFGRVDEPYYSSTPLPSLEQRGIPHLVRPVLPYPGFSNQQSSCLGRNAECELLRADMPKACCTGTANVEGCGVSSYGIPGPARRGKCATLPSKLGHPDANKPVERESMFLNRYIRLFGSRTYHTSIESSPWISDCSADIIFPSLKILPISLFPVLVSCSLYTL